VHNYGCNFNCTWCSYKLRANFERPKRFLTNAQVMKVLSTLDIERVHFVGGEPTTYTGLEELALFCHEQLGVVTKIGHSNGANIPPRGIDEANISIKTIRDDIHLTHCCESNRRVLRNFRIAYDRGIRLDVSSVLIPGLIDIPQIAEVARFIAEIDDSIPYHIIGYIPVPGVPWRRPTLSEMERAEREARSFLKNVSTSCWSAEDWRRDPAERDPRYRKIRVA